MTVKETSLPMVLGGSPMGRFLQRQWPLFGEEERHNLMQVLDSGRWAFDGPFEAKFEGQFASLQNAKYGLCVANGTIAIQLALEALDIGAGDEVIVPGLTWQATAAAVLDVNATPVMVDAEPDTYCPDPSLIEAAITPRTKAIIVVHLYCSMTDMDRVLDIAKRNGLFVIEDCAHAHGSQWNGKGAGSIGDIGCFSFQLSKTLTGGEGGFVTTNDPALREALYTLRNCGRRREGAIDSQWRPIQSGNYRMTEWQSAILLAQLGRFEEQMERHEQNARILDKELALIPGIAPMRVPEQMSRRNFYAYVFRYDADEWDGLKATSFRRALAEEVGVLIGTTYAPLNASPFYQPQTKRRHHLNDEYWKMIDPSRFNLPVAQRAYHDEAMVVQHEILLEDPERLLMLPAAIRKLREYKAELLDWEAKSIQN